MSEINYKPNSHKFKEEQKSSEDKKKVEKVITGVAKVKKKSEMRKLADVFISDDVKNVKSYILMDVLIPAAKKAISDIVTDGISMILYGSTGRVGKGNGASKVSYRNYYDRKNDHRPLGDQRSRSSYDYDNVTFDSRGDAEEVLERMDELIRDYGYVTVADLYDLAGITPNFTDYKYGWTNIRNVEPARLRDGGYALRLPRVEPIE